MRILKIYHIDVDHILRIYSIILDRVKICCRLEIGIELDAGQQNKFSKITITFKIG